MDQTKQKINLSRIYLMLVELESTAMKRINELRSNGIYAPRTEKFLHDEYRKKNNCDPRLAANGLPEIIYFSKKMDILFEQLERSNNRSIADVLKAKFRALGINNIRNQIAHPDEELLDRDIGPILNKVKEFLSLKELEACGIDIPAIFNLVSSLSEEQVISKASQESEREPSYKADDLIKNNLPKPFDFQHTGLIGRTNDLVNLHRTWRRNVTIVAPGGIGKTALVLEFLSQLANDTSVEGELDGIVFVSFKQEVLGISGITHQRKTPTREEMYGEIFDSVKTVLGNIPDYEMRNHRILLCLDNLEEIVKDYDDRFNEDLISVIPDSWSYLITSRVRVIGTHMITLDRMDNESLTTLCEAYFSRLGIEIIPHVVEKLVNRSKGNPLYLHLATLLFSKKGMEWPDVFVEAEESVLNFSFRHVLPNLSKSELAILCALTFFNAPATRGGLIKVANLDSSDIGPAITALEKMVLIDRKTNEDDHRDRIEIKPLFKEVVALSENIYEIKSDIERRYNKYMTNNNQRKNPFSIHSHNKNYISPNAPEDLKTLLAETYFNDNIEKRTKLFHLRKFCTEYENLPDYHYYVGRLLEGEMAVVEFSKAYELDNNHYYALLKIASKTKFNDCERAINYLKILIDKRMDESANSTPEFASHLFFEYSLSLSRAKRFDDAVKYLDNYKTKCVGYMGSALLNRLRTLIRVVQFYSNKQLDIKPYLELLIQAIGEVHQVYEIDEERSYADSWPDLRSELLNSCIKEMDNTFGYLRSKSPPLNLSELEQAMERLRTSVLDKNTSSSNYLSPEKLMAKGFQRYIIESIGSGGNFGFAYHKEDISKKVYFHMSALRTESQKEWSELRPKDKIYGIQSLEKTQTNKAPNLSSFVFLANA